MPTKQELKRVAVKDHNARYANEKERLFKMSEEEIRDEEMMNAVTKATADIIPVARKFVTGD